ncbi:unnamed protein product [Blumeria hordei]|uniref:Uncharacterized protein n=1 Tax=Blumeria hordei TaxID=2867405 RepID=A0A383UPY6_BLUHO|nr:unnamed protein product [Blumeria hordei]
MTQVTVGLFCLEKAEIKNIAQERYSPYSEVCNLLRFTGEVDP